MLFSDGHFFSIFTMGNNCYFFSRDFSYKSLGLADEWKHKTILSQISPAWREAALCERAVTFGWHSHSSSTDEWQHPASSGIMKFACLIWSNVVGGGIVVAVK